MKLAVIDGCQARWVKPGECVTVYHIGGCDGESGERWGRILYVDRYAANATVLTFVNGNNVRTQPSARVDILGLGAACKHWGNR